MFILVLLSSGFEKRGEIKSHLKTPPKVFGLAGYVVFNYFLSSVLTGDNLTFPLVLADFGHCQVKVFAFPMEPFFALPANTSVWILRSVRIFFCDRVCYLSLAVVLFYVWFIHFVFIAPFSC